MVMAVMGSRGPWTLDEEFQMDIDTMSVILSRWSFTLDGMATRLNRICLRYISGQWEMEAIRRDFFSQLVGADEFVFLHPHPRHYGRLLLHLQRSEARGCLIFQCRTSLPSFSRFWAGRWARWVVQAVELSPAFFNTLLDWQQNPSFKVFCLEFDFGVADPFGFQIRIL